ncbi:MAG: sulfur transferase domain-containing protein [Acidobacteriota bacterium]
MLSRLFAVFALASAAVAPGEDVADGIRNFTKVDATFACAGATPTEAMPRLARAGYSAVLNLRTEGESGVDVPAARAAAEAAGLRYLHLPFRTPTDEAAESFLQMTSDEQNHPLFIHCGSANRVGAMWLLKRVLLDGWPIDDATREAKEIGLRSPELEAFALDYLKRHG